MSTTRFWGEPDDGIKVRRAKGRPLYEMDVNILGSNWGNGWPEGSKISGELYQVQCI